MLTTVTVLSWVVTTHAADVSVQPASGSGFVVKDAAGATDRFRVQENGQITLPGIGSAAAQTQALCASSAGLLGPCSGGSGGSTTYFAGTGLALSGTTFSVAPTYQLPQSCGANQVAQWSGSAWICATVSGASLPAGTVNQTLRYDSSNTLVANTLLQAFSDGGLLATGTFGSGAIPASGPGVRLMWYPKKRAFRAGGVATTEWDDANIGDGSIGLGLGTIAGDAALATGFDTKATGLLSTAMGSGSAASGRASTAMGDTTQAIGGGSTAMGTGSKASGDDSTAMGKSSIASGLVATAMGYATQAVGEDSTAMGRVTVASGDMSSALGYHTIATGNSSTALGNTTTASGANATAMGHNTTASGDNSIALGDSSDTASKAHAFVYGDGTQPVKALAANQFAALSTAGCVTGADCSALPPAFVFYTSSNAGPQVFWTGAQLAAGSGSWSALSDRAMKTDFQAVDTRALLEKVAALPMTTWSYKAQGRVRHIGAIAQDFYSAFGVGEDDRHISTVDADGVALAAIQGLYVQGQDEDRTIGELRAQVATLHAALRTQQLRVAQLESQTAAIGELKAAVAALQRRAIDPALALAEMRP